MSTVIATDRMLLSPITGAAAQPLFEIWAQPAVRQYLCDDQIFPLSQIEEMIEQSVIAHQEKRYGLWVARLKSDPAIVGFTGYWTFFDPPEVQLVYGLAEGYWKRGLATEMARAMIDYGFRAYQLSEIRASADLPNTDSIALMQRLGMTFEKQVTINGLETVFYTLPKPAA